MNSNAPAIFKSLIVYAVCVPVAIFVGFSLANPLDYSTLGFYGVLAMLLLTPALLRWHYPLLLLSWNMSMILVILPSRPIFWLPMVLVSLGISILERIMNDDKHFIRVPQITWPLVALLAVTYFTAEMTGGFGFQTMGSSVYGGKKYLYLIVGILSYFALSARRIPLEKAHRYVGLFFLGGLTACIGDLYAITPSPLHFIYVLFPPNSYGEDQYGNYTLDFGMTRMSGVAITASLVMFWMLARHGLRGIFLSGKIGRPFLFLLFSCLIFLGGFRSVIIAVSFVVVVQFFVERLHRSRLLLPMLFAGVLGTVLLIPLAHHLPWTVQRSLAFLPLDIDQDARQNAEGSSEWRLNIWKALLPQVPGHLLVGKGFSIPTETFDEMMGGSAMGYMTADAANNPLALSGDYHSGPFSVVLSFGIWGTVAWLWFWGASLRVLYRNYKHGHPALHHINLLLFVYFIVKCIMFLFVFGAMQNDIAVFAGIIGLNVALNHGVARPAPQTIQVRPPATAGRPFPVPRPAFPR